MINVSYHIINKNTNEWYVKREARDKERGDSKNAINATQINWALRAYSILVLKGSKSFKASKHTLFLASFLSAIPFTIHESWLQPILRSLIHLRSRVRFWLQCNLIKVIFGKLVGFLFLTRSGQPIYDCYNKKKNILGKHLLRPLTNQDWKQVCYNKFDASQVHVKSLLSLQEEFFLCLSLILSSQYNLPIWHWQMHTNY